MKFKLTSTFVGCAILAAMLLGAMVPVPAQQAGGADVFKAKCAMCHGADATGKTPMGSKLSIPDLRSVQKQPAATLEQAVTKGKNKMPAFEGKLTPQQITQVVGYIQQLK